MNSAGRPLLRSKPPKKSDRDLSPDVLSDAESELGRRVEKLGGCRQTEVEKRAIQVLRRKKKSQSHLPIPSNSVVANTVTKRGSSPAVKRRSQRTKFQTLAVI